MLKIRRAQWEALADYALARFVERMIPGLRRRFGAELRGKDDATLAAELRDTIGAAREAGITREADVRRWVEYCSLYGLDFAELPWVADVLEDRTLSGAVKMRRLGERELQALRDGDA